MKPEEKKEMIELFNEGFTNIVLPHIDKIYDKLQEHTEILQEHSEILKEHGDQLDSIDRKIEPQFRRIDKHDIDLETHEKRIGRLEVKMAGK